MNLSSLSKLGLVFLVARSVSGCGFGLIVPQVREFYEGTDAAAIRINHIESQIACEVREAVRNILYVDETRTTGNGQPLPPTLTWLKYWESTSTLKVTIIENSALNPGVSFLTPMIGAITRFPVNVIVPAGQNYNLGISGTASSEASVDDSSAFSLLFANFLGDRDWKDYLSKRRAGFDPSCWHSGDFLMEGDLGFKEWLKDRLLPVLAENIPAPKTSIQRHVFCNKWKYNTDMEVSAHFYNVISASSDWKDAHL